MFKNFYLVLITVVLIISCAPVKKDLLVADLGNEKITLTEFENEYLKSASTVKNAQKQSIEDYKHFLDLYVNFKLKLKEAKELGIDKDDSLLTELENYKKNIGEEFLIEKYVRSPGLEKLYDKRKYEYRIAHIMLMVGDEGLDSAKARAKILIDSLNSGADWNKFVKKYSKDKNTIKANGQLFWVTAGELAPQFEKVVLNMKVGEVYKEAIPSTYAVHILKLNAKRERFGTVDAQHILISLKDKDGKKLDYKKSKEKADSIYNLIKNGADFTQLAIDNSDDKASAVLGGFLEKIERRKTVPEFNEIVFTLKPNEISEPVKTQFGYHIIKVIKHNPQPPFEQEKVKLKRTYEKVYFQQDLDSYIDSLKAKFAFKKYSDNVSTFAEEFKDLTFSEMRDTLNKRNESFKVFEIDSVVYDVKNIFNLKYFEKYSKTPFNHENYRHYLKSVIQQILLEKEINDQIKGETELAKVFKEYYYGLQIFKLQEREVWNKVKITDDEIQKYFDKNANKYKWPERISYRVYSHYNKNKVKDYCELIKNGYTEAEADSAFANRKGGNVKIRNVEKVSFDFDSITKIAKKFNKGEFTHLIQDQNGLWSKVKILEKIPAGAKNFEEAKSEIRNLLHEEKIKIRNKEYSKELRNKFNPKIFYENLNYAFKEI